MVFVIPYCDSSRRPIEDEPRDRSQIIGPRLEDIQMTDRLIRQQTRLLLCAPLAQNSHECGLSGSSGIVIVLIFRVFPPLGIQKMTGDLEHQPQIMGCLSKVVHETEDGFAVEFPAPSEEFRNTVLSLIADG